MGTGDLVLAGGLPSRIGEEVGKGVMSGVCDFAGCLLGGGGGNVHG